MWDKMKLFALHSAGPEMGKDHKNLQQADKTCEIKQ